jgi:hypothetical protein
MDTYSEQTTPTEQPQHGAFLARLRKGFSMQVGSRAGKAIVIEGDDKKRVAVDRETAIANMAKFHETDKIRKHFGLAPIGARVSEPVSSPRGGGMSEAEVRKIVRETVRTEVDALARLIDGLKASIVELSKNGAPAAAAAPKTARGARKR